MYGVLLASHVVNGHGVFFSPGPQQYSPITHEWAQTSPKGLELWEIRVSGFPFIFIDQVPSMIWSRQKQTQTYSNTLKQGESSISHAHTFNNLPVLYIYIYIHILICINTNSNTWFVASLCFIRLPFNGLPPCHDGSSWRLRLRMSCHRHRTERQPRWKFLRIVAS